MDGLRDGINGDDAGADVSVAREVRPEIRTSPAVLRLLDEVRCDESTGYSAMQCYDRDHNRHNR